MGGFGDSIDKYEVYELLGKGGFGQVYRARVRETGMEVAIKMIDKKLMKQARMVNRVKQEVSIHSRLKHPSVLELYTCFEDDYQVYLVLELCHNGELQSYMRTKKLTFTEDEARHILRQVVEGLIYLHSHKIIHRDITLANLLLTKDMTVKIGDFGLATQLNSPDEKHMTMCGTPNYISPEIAVRSSHGLETDVWGLGIILYTILLGKPPFDTENREMILTQIAMREIEFPDHLSTDCVDLMRCLLKKNPKDRISLNKILEHPFMVRSFSGFNPSSHCGSRDSGMAVSLSSTLKTKSYSDRVLDSNVGRPPVPMYPLLPNPMVHNNNMSIHKPSGYSNCCSSMSVSSNHVCTVPFKSALSDRRSVDISQNGIIQGNPLYPNSADVPTFEPPSQRFHSAPTSMSCKDTNCSHAWKQCGCGQCSHVETCSCMHSRGMYSNGGSSACGYPNNNHSSNYTSGYQHQEPAFKPTHSSQEHKQTSMANGASQPKPHAPSLNTNRLKPIRQKTKQVILNILESGEVCLEFIKQKNKSEKVLEVLRISPDGQRIVVYYPNKGKGVKPGDTPPELPSGGADGIFSHENLPEKFIKKYSYASRFVDLVRAQTPKLIYYSHKAKCMLMENGPDPDFQVHFYDGAKFNKVGQQVKITDENGWSSTQHISSDGTGLPAPVKIMWEHFRLCLDECRTREKLLDEISSSTGLSMFPNRIGERPRKAVNNTPSSKSSAPVESRPPSAGKAASVVSSSGGSLRRGKIVKQLQLPNICNAMQMSNGVICLEYPDCSKLFVGSTLSNISIQDPYGNSKQINYHEFDKFSPETREKLTHVRTVIETFKNTT